MKAKTLLNLKTTTMAALVALTFTPLTSHADALEDVPSTEKLIRIRSADPDQSNKLSLQLSTEQDSYRVNEPIRFKVRTNKQAFLYLINVDAGTGKAVTIMPNRLQTNRELRYPATNNWNLVPNKSLEFYSDRPGTERIVLIASERYLDVSKLKSAGNSKSLGNFFAMDNPLDALDTVINDAYNEGGGTEKRIRIRRNESTGRRLPPGIVVKEVYLRIR